MEDGHMKAIRSSGGRLTVLTVLFFLATVLNAPPSAAVNSIADPGFESGFLSMGPQFGAMPPSFGFWSIRANTPPISVVNTPVRSGSNALGIDTRTTTYGSVAIQDFPANQVSYVWSFWVHPAEGFNAAEIIFNWDRGVTGSGDIATRLDYDSSGTSFRAWDTSATFPPIPSGGWHEVRVVADRCTLAQDYYLDGAFVGIVQATSTVATPGNATAIYGDTGNYAKHGLYYYDDVFYEEFDCAAPPRLCPRSQGFWKTHLEAWPAMDLVLGGASYNQTELLVLLHRPPRGDASLILAHQLIAARLNEANGADAGPVAQTLLDADALLAMYSGKLPYGVHAATPEGEAMAALGEHLDEFNKGELALGCGADGSVAPLGDLVTEAADRERLSDVPPPAPRSEPVPI